MYLQEFRHIFVYLKCISLCLFYFISFFFHLQIIVIDSELDYIVK